MQKKVMQRIKKIKTNESLGKEITKIKAEI